MGNELINKSCEEIRKMDKCMECPFNRFSVLCDSTIRNAPIIRTIEILEYEIKEVRKELGDK